MPTYNKEDIIKLAKNDKFFKYDLTNNAMRRRLNKTIDLLLHSDKIERERLQLENNGVLLDQEPPEKEYDSYQYNPQTFFLLVVVFKHIEDDYFKNLLKIGKEYLIQEESDRLMKEFESTVSRYRSIIKGQMREEQNEDFFIFYVLDFLYKLVNPPLITEKIEDINEEIMDLFLKMLSLPSWLKVDVYEQSKKRLHYIRDNYLKEAENKMKDYEKILYRLDQEEVAHFKKEHFNRS